MVRHRGRMQSDAIGIIGAGVCGLTAARLLRQSGRRVVVLDKGRASGGRVATRISRDGHAFDHGAQYISARSPVFQSVLNGAMSTGSLASWEPVPGLLRYVGAPGMVDFARHLARAVDVHQGVEVTAIRPEGTGWRATHADGDAVFGTLVVTCPAPQAARLLGPMAMADEIAAIEMAPCLTVMAAFRPGRAPEFASRRDPQASLAWIAHDTSKPMRDDGARFVGQAGEAFSRLHLEADKPEIAELMLPLLAEEIGRDPAEAIYVAGHRWRYARAVEPLGKPFLADESGTLFAGGDWCLGARVEAAWESGVAIAEAIIGT